LISLGQIYEQKGLLAEADSAFRAATVVRATDTIPWNYLGTFLMRRERIEGAIEALKMGLSSEGSTDEIHYNLGGCYVLLDQLDAAVAEYSAAIAIDPGYELAKKQLADLQALQELRGRMKQRSGQSL
jgi:Tfp pilus assembly protein PilF